MPVIYSTHNIQYVTSIFKCLYTRVVHLRQFLRLIVNNDVVMLKHTAYYCPLPNGYVQAGQIRQKVALVTEMNQKKWYLKNLCFSFEIRSLHSCRQVQRYTLLIEVSLLADGVGCSCQSHCCKINQKHKVFPYTCTLTSVYVIRLL